MNSTTRDELMLILRNVRDDIQRTKAQLDDILSELKWQRSIEVATQRQLMELDVAVKNDTDTGGVSGGYGVTTAVNPIK